MNKALQNGLKKLGTYLFIAIMFGIGFTIVLSLAVNNPAGWTARVFDYFYFDKSTVDEKPTDCDFLHAPIGFKNCWYRASTMILIRRKDGTSQLYLIKNKESPYDLTYQDAQHRGKEIRVSWERTER